MAELALAVPPTIDLCRKYFSECKALLSARKHANKELMEHMVQLDAMALRFSMQEGLLQRVKHVMEPEHIETYENTLGIFQSKLQLLLPQLRSLLNVQASDGGNSVSTIFKARSTKYAIKKNSLDKAFQELELWQSMADQSWFLIMRIADSQVDAALSKTPDDATKSTAQAIPSATTIRAMMQQDNAQREGHYLLSSRGLARMSINAIAHSDSMLVATRHSSSGRQDVFILNRVSCQPASKLQSTKKDVRDLVHRLQHDEPYTFGLLKCKGFAVDNAPTGSTSPKSDATLTLVFRQPPNASDPKSLRELLLDATPDTSTTLRLGIARDVAKSVGFVHTFGFVHKNVRPESILIFNLMQGSDKATFLAGFENFRRDEGWTRRLGDELPDKNLYRHASRQGSSPQEDYIMQHDIYSLGVCLLEIGLWGSFVRYDPSNDSRTLSPFLGIPAGLSRSETSKFLLAEVKDHFLDLARSRLPGKMGDEYTGIVETCLTCLDPDNVDFGDETEFEDKNGVRVGARYIEKVLQRLHMLSM